MNYPPTWRVVNIWVCRFTNVSCNQHLRSKLASSPLAWRARFTGSKMILRTSVATTNPNASAHRSCRQPKTSYLQILLKSSPKRNSVLKVATPAAFAAKATAVNDFSAHSAAIVVTARRWFATLSPSSEKQLTLRWPTSICTLHSTQSTQTSFSRSSLRLLPSRWFVELTPTVHRYTSPHACSQQRCGCYKL